MLSDEEIVLKRLKETLDVLKGKNVITRLDFQIRDMVEDCIRVIEEQQKNNENWKKYCDEQENDITLKNNKICDLEFKIEKQQKEIERTNEILIWKQKHEEQLQKEIEELKETNEEIGKALDEWNNGERTSIFHIHKDKIKAKIEEVHYKMIGHQDLREAVKQVLQSLLEKE